MLRLTHEALSRARTHASEHTVPLVNCIFPPTRHWLIRDSLILEICIGTAWKRVQVVLLGT